MLLAKVISRVVSSAKLESLPDRPLLCVEPLDGFGEARRRIIAIDGVQAGPGETVLVLEEGTGARDVVLEDPKLPMPAQAVIVGIVDAIQT